MAATADPVEQERVVALPRLEARPAQFQPVVQRLEGPFGGVLDQLLVAFAQHPQAALGEIDLRKVEVDRLGLAHPRAIQNRNDRRIATPLRPGVGSTGFHQLTNQRATDVAALDQSRTADRFDRADFQQLIVADQVVPPGFVHHAANGIHIQRGGIGRVVILAQRCDQCGHVAGLQGVPGNIMNIDVSHAQPVRRILQNVGHGQAA